MTNEHPAEPGRRWSSNRSSASGRSRPPPYRILPSAARIVVSPGMYVHSPFGPTVQGRKVQWPARASTEAAASIIHP